jgi:hypothetical protein
MWKCSRLGIGVISDAEEADKKATRVIQRPGDNSISIVRVGFSDFAWV